MQHSKFTKVNISMLSIKASMDIEEKNHCRILWTQRLWITSGKVGMPNAVNIQNRK